MQRVKYLYVVRCIFFQNENENMTFILKFMIVPQENFIVSLYPLF